LCSDPYCFVASLIHSTSVARRGQPASRASYAGMVRNSAMRFSASSSVRGDSGPRLGQHTRTVLADLDMPADKIDALIDAGVAVQA